MGKGIKFPRLDGAAIRIGIVKARWNAGVTDALDAGCRAALRECGVKEDNIFSLEVPGSFETVFGAKELIEKKRVDAVICLGVLIKGETMHFEYLCSAVSEGIMRLGLDTGVPVVFGILTCLTEAQARARAVGENNHGIGWGKTTVEMALLSKQKK